jgi:hypothetical protein
MAYYVRPADPTVVAEREREKLAREEIRKHTAEVARQTQDMNVEQEKLERKQQAEREQLRKLTEKEEDEARLLADRLEREQRVSARARAILRDRGYDFDVDIFGRAS